MAQISYPTVTKPKPPSNPYANIQVKAAPKVDPVVSMVRPTGPTPTNNFFNYTLPTFPAPKPVVAPVYNPRALTGQSAYNAQMARDQNRVDEAPNSGVTTQNKYNAWNETPAMVAARNSGLGYIADAFRPFDTAKFGTTQQMAQNAVDFSGDALSIGMGAAAAGPVGALTSGASNFLMKGIDFASNYYDLPGLNTAVGGGALGLSALQLIPAAAAFNRKDYVRAAKLAGPLAVTALKIGGVGALSKYIFEKTGIRAGDAISNLADVYPLTNLMGQYNDYGYTFTHTNNYPSEFAHSRLGQPGVDDSTIKQFLQNQADSKAYSSQGNPLMGLAKSLTNPLPASPHTNTRWENFTKFAKAAFNPNNSAFHIPSSWGTKNAGHNFYNAVSPFLHGFNPWTARDDFVHESMGHGYGVVTDPVYRQAMANMKLIPGPGSGNRQNRKYLMRPDEQTGNAAMVASRLYNQGPQPGENQNQWEYRIQQAAKNTVFSDEYSQKRNPDGLVKFLEQIKLLQPRNP